MENRSLIGEILQTDLRPLTRLQRNGEVQARTSETEKEIKELLSLESSAFIYRLKVVNSEKEGFVSEESLVFFLRAAAFAENKEILNEVSQALLSRCQQRINSYVRKVGAKIEDFDECVDDVVSDLFISLCNINSDACDFAQVRFWRFMKWFCFNSLEDYKKRHKKSLLTDSIDAPVNDDGQTFEIAAAEEKYSSIDLVDLKKGLAVLPEPIRTAFILRHRGWQVESKEPCTPTISKYFGKTERTIRNWLMEADRLLANWREANV